MDLDITGGVFNGILFHAVVCTKLHRAHEQGKEDGEEYG